MKFGQMEYVRPQAAEVESRFDALLKAFAGAETVDEQDAAMKQINDLRNDIDTMENIVFIRHTVDTNDEFYKKEQEYFDETLPVFQGLTSRFYKALVTSKFRDQLEEKWGRHLFNMAEMTLKTYSPEVVEDMKRENRLTTEYTKLIASARIDFEGEERNLSQLQPFQQSEDREVRKRASEVKYGFMQEKEKDLDRIYDELVKVRTTIAQKLGFDTFTELGYARMMRTDYSPEMVSKFRDQVKEVVVPLATKLREEQRQRIGVRRLTYYDESYQFKCGNPKPQGDPEWIIENGKTMYAELSPETDEFFTCMIDNKLTDLVSKKGKAGGGYCTYIANQSVPFIFSNFNGTSGDIRVLTHEAGHAFQMYSQQNEVPEYHVPTMEAAEIHSMSMEFFTWPWMKLFFEHETDKYKLSHISDAVLAVPYIVAVDEFQHFVYENSEATPQERKEAWREIEKKYLPHRNYEGNDYLENGAFWHQQSHIFQDPFYYIDYALALICALQFWKRIQNRDEAAWEDYVALCRRGGDAPFTELAKSANLVSPFEDGCVKSVVGVVEQYIDSIGRVE